MTEPEEPNLFIDLEIDPSLPWNQEVFDKALKDKAQIWQLHLQSFDNQKKEWSRRMMSRRPFYEAIAVDEQKRKTQQEQAKILLPKKREDLVKKLKDDISVSAGKGYILKGQFNQWLKMYGLTDQQLRKLIEVPVLDEAPTKGTPSKARPLDTVTAEGIASYLEMAKKRSLYDFLGLPENTPRETLYARAGEVYVENNRKGNKDDLDIMRTIALAGLCRTVFKDDEAQARYEETLRLSAFEFLKGLVDTAAGGGNEIVAEQVEILLKEASKRKLDVDESIRFIQSYAAKKYSLVLPETLVPAIKQMRRCPSCTNMNPEAAKACSICGAILQESCPKCKGAIPTGHQACPQCSFPIGNRGYIDLVLREANQCLLGGRNTDADKKLKQIEIDQLWPSINDALGKRIETLRKAIDEANAEALAEKTKQAAAVKEIEALRGQRKYYQVRRSIAEWKLKLKTAPKDFEIFQQQAKEEIDRAEIKIIAARKDRDDGQVDQAILKYQEALSICSDCEEALLELKRTPPSPPKNLEVEKVGERLVRLKWQASPSPQVDYAVLRQKERSPNNPADGERIATVRATAYDDTTSKPGISYFYAVYTARGEVTSTESAKSSQPVLLTDEVAGLVACAESERIELQWIPSETACDIQVRRNQGLKFPTSLEEGVVIPLLGKERAIDAALHNGETYSYTVFAIFKNINGNQVVSKGAHITAVPQSPPEIVTSLRITKVSDAPLAFEIAWDPPEGSQTVAIIRSEKSLNVEPGTPLPRIGIEKYGRLLVPSGNSVRDEPGNIRTCYYTPISIQQDTAYAGKEKRFVSVPDVTQLKAEKHNGVIRLTWEWPNDCTEVTGAVSLRKPDNPASPPINAAEFRTSLDMYRQKTCVEISMAPGMEHIIDVFAVYNAGKEWIKSSGVQLKVNPQQIYLTYWIKTGRFGQRPTLVIESLGTGQMPMLNLVYNAQRAPLNRDDGVFIMTIPSRRLLQDRNKMTFPLPDDSYPRGSVVKLFLGNDDYKDDVILYPCGDQLRINR